MNTRLIAGLFAVAVMASCSGKKDTSSQENDTTQPQPVAVIDIAGQWNIDNIVLGDTVSVRPAEQTPGTEQYIVFTDSTYSIITNCNSLSGSYTLTGDSITLGDGMMTEMACDNMATEDALRTIIPHIATLNVETDSTIRLNSSNPTDYIILSKSTSKVML